MNRTRQLASEFIATALLLTVVIGSGVMGERLTEGQPALALLANSVATAAGLYVLIEIFGPISAHMNPVVSLVQAVRGELSWSALGPNVAAQLSGAVCGAALAHAMFGLPMLEWSSTVRTGAGLWLAEIVATAGLVVVVLRAPAGRSATLVAAYIGAAYWFTASTSFANPAATFGRMFSDTFTGVSPASVSPFMAAQLVGAALGMWVDRLLGRSAPITTPASTVR